MGFESGATVDHDALLAGIAHAQGRRRGSGSGSGSGNGNGSGAKMEREESQVERVSG